MSATLDFVRDMQAAWNVPITWLEFTARRADGFCEVSHNNASRNGEPFAALLATQPSLPNPVQRSCTTEMKIRTIKRWCMARGWKHWLNVIGLRADESRRVAKTKLPQKERWTVATPLADAGVTVGDVAAFWRAQPFDLMLNGKWEGNCDGCFLKSRAGILRMARDYPDRMQWWAQMESVARGSDGVNRRFRIDRETYAEMADLVQSMPRLPFDETMIDGGEECDSGCGI